MDLCEQMGSALLQGIVGACFATNISVWTHHLPASIAYSRRAHEAALSSGNTTCARRSGALVALFRDEWEVARAVRDQSSWAFHETAPIR